MPRAAVFGLGKVGLSACELLISRGYEVVVFDQKPLESESQLSLLDRIQGLGAQLISGWHGRWTDEPVEFVVVSPGFQHLHPAIQDCQRAGIPLISELELAFRMNPGVRWVMVTGGMGKSTVACCVADLLRSHGVKATACGRIIRNEKPEPTFSQAVRSAGDDEVLVAAVSLKQLQWVQSFHPNAVAVLNGGEFRGDPYYWDVLLHKSVKNLGPEDTLVLPLGLGQVNPDQIVGLTFMRRYVGNEGVAAWPTASDFDADSVIVGSHRAKTRVQPALAAVSLELARAVLGEAAELPVLMRTLESFQPLPYRHQKLGKLGGHEIINDAACNTLERLRAQLHEASPNDLFLVSSELRASIDGKNIVFFESTDDFVPPSGKWDDLSYNLSQALRKATEISHPEGRIIFAPGVTRIGMVSGLAPIGSLFQRVVASQQEAEEK